MTDPIRVFVCEKCTALYTAEMGKCAVCSKSKMHNTKVVVDNLTFDSIGEYNQWKELQLRERAGEIRDLHRQVRYKVYLNEIYICSWYADFVYFDIALNQQIIADFKGFRTAVYAIKKRLVEAYYTIQITEIEAQPIKRKRVA